MSLTLTRLYGHKAIEFHDGKLNYRSNNGFVDLPVHLVQRAIDQGFSRTPFAGIALAEDAAPSSPAPALETSDVGAGAQTGAPATPDTDPAAPPAPPVQAAVQASALPADHPQTLETGRIASQEALKAAEARLRPGVGTA